MTGPFFHLQVLIFFDGVLAAFAYFAVQALKIFLLLLSKNTKMVFVSHRRWIDLKEANHVGINTVDITGIVHREDPGLDILQDQFHKNITLFQRFIGFDQRFLADR